MNNKILKELLREFRNNYNLELSSFCPLTSKSYKVITKNNDKLLIKKSKEKVKSKYMYLKNEGIDNIIYPVFNNKNSITTRLSKDIYCDDCYYIVPFIDDNNVLNEKKAKSLLEELQKLHIKTSFNRKLSINKSKKKMEEMIIFLDYQFSVIEAFVRTIEAQSYDEFSIPILKNYQYILKAKNIMIEKNRKIVNNIKLEKSVIFCFLHNNPKIDHLIINEGNKYLISIDNGIIGIPSLDIAKYYIENEDIYFDISSHILNYFNEFDDDFYFDYFIYLVMFLYLKGLIIDSKGYISTQSFIFTAKSLNKFIINFNLEK